VDLSDKTALHLLAVQTLDMDVESSVQYYASIISINADKLRQVSDYMVADAYFAETSFVTVVTEVKLHLNTRLRKDQVLYYVYTGPRRKGASAPRRYDGRVNVHDLRDDVFVPCAIADDKSWMAFEAVVYVKAWKRKAKVVIIHGYDAKGEFISHSSLVSTDLALDGGNLVLGYTCRFQQEFLYRDAKQEIGLEDCQA
jgi:hypothetical protein